MKQLTSYARYLVVALAGGALFMGMAALADWTAPTSNPPTCPAADPACNPPVNVSANAQSKAGGLSVYGNFPAYQATPINSPSYPYKFYVNGFSGFNGFASYDNSGIAKTNDKGQTIGLNFIVGKAWGGTATLWATSPMIDSYGGDGLELNRWSGQPNVNAPVQNVGVGLGSKPTNRLAWWNLRTGESNQKYKLQVGGTVLATEFCNIDDPAQCASLGGTSTGGSSDSLWATSTQNANNIYNKNSGNVGVGKTNPSTKLDVAGIGWFDGGVATVGTVAAANAALNKAIHIDANGTYSDIKSVNTLLMINGEGQNTLINPNSGKVGIAVGTDLGPNLKLRVGGDVGADRYCDRNGNNCIVPGTTNTTKIWYTGEHCGVRVAFEGGNGGTLPHETATGYVPCPVNGINYDPRVSCPSGFVRVGGDFANSNDEVYPDRFFFTCVKS